MENQYAYNVRFVPVILLILSILTVLLSAVIGHFANKKKEKKINTYLPIDEPVADYEENW